MLAIEFLISRADGKSQHRARAQILNDAMLTALLRTLRGILAGEDFTRHLSLARKTYAGRRRLTDARARLGFRWVKMGVDRLGRGYEESIAMNGVPGLHWPSLSFSLSGRRNCGAWRSSTARWAAVGQCASHHREG
jgi:hypothetical protein